ncbi:MAG: DoxX family protein [Methylobacterium sp. CG08_land_8_20_14_0_20_71_15]|nr:MAG: DoxX family protein [Methylobacterium sp. CG09_land_8_20_14_0_10_71_15]PIU15203.1 MAG: DoxX family protein [Methylobacterium sp. CG08_land_8_20_14_0_20_71_15]
MRLVLLVLLTGLYAGIGAVHLLAPERLLPIVPPWVPSPRLVVLATGGCEALGAVALWLPRLRRPAAALLALYAVCVFPANLHHAWQGIHVEGLPDSWWYHGPRLAFQPVLVWAALFAGGIIDWPFRASEGR